MTQAETLSNQLRLEIGRIVDEHRKKYGWAPIQIDIDVLQSMSIGSKPWAFIDRVRITAPELPFTNSFHKVGG